MGISIPFSFRLMSLQATENSLRSIFPSPFISARPLREKRGVRVSTGTKIDVSLPDLSQDWRRQACLHEESPGLTSSDESLRRADTAELLHVSGPLLG